MIHHLHLFLEFAEPKFVEDIRSWVSILCGGYGENVRFDCQPCRSRKTCLKYITKEGHNAFTNIKESDLSFYYRAHKWASRTPQFRFDDPFVVEHRFCYYFLRKMHCDVRIINEILREVIAGYPEILLEAFNSCLREGRFFDDWKKQKLVLLRKGNKPLEEALSYKPICLLDTMENLLEELILQR